MSKRRKDKSGRCAGGKSFARGAPSTRCCRTGFIAARLHTRAKPTRANHQAVIDAELWQSVQREASRSESAGPYAGGRCARPSLLCGLFIDEDGKRMTPTHAVKSGKRYRYYVSTPLITGRRSALQSGRRFPAGEIEGLVTDRLRAFFASPRQVCEVLASLDLAAPMQHAVLENFCCSACRALGEIAGA